MVMKDVGLGQTSTATGCRFSAEFSPHYLCTGKGNQHRSPLGSYHVWMRVIYELPRQKGSCQNHAEVNLNHVF